MQQRFTILTITAVAVLSLIATTLRAGPNFVKGPTYSLTSTGDYTVTFKEAGLGNTPVTYSLTATTEKFTFQCFTKSGNTPEGAPNTVSFSNVVDFRHYNSS